MSDPTKPSWPGSEGYTWFNVFEAAGRSPESGEAYRCPRCQTTRLECFGSDAYETAVRCPDCKLWTVVHDG